MTRHEQPAWSRRAVLLAVASAVILACFWSFGGVGFAQPSVAAHQYQYGGKKVKVCHKGKRTIRVSRSALPAHLAHGDTVGKCRKDRGKRGHDRDRDRRDGRRG